MMLKAVIDTGANSVKLVLLKKENGKFIRVLNKLEITRLAEDLDKSGVFKPEAMKRTLRVISEFVNTAEKEGAEEIKILGMAAFRKAENSADFIEEIKNATGIILRVLTGDEEAYLGLIGVAKTLDADNFILLDIGGGSIELCAKYGEEEFLKSIPIGAVNLYENFIKNEPPLDDERVAVENYIREKINRDSSHLINGSCPYLFYLFSAPIFGVGGTITTIADMMMGLPEFDTDKTHLYKMRYDDLKKLNDKLWKMPLEERKKITGLHPQRADVIIAGASIIQVVMEILNKDILTVSVANLVEGVLYE